LRHFTNSDQLVALMGIHPQLNAFGPSAGQVQQMSERGSPYLHRAIWNTALTACRLASMCQAIYDRQWNKHHLVALSHVAHKLTHVIDAVLKGQRPYVPDYFVGANVG
jgi:transposase